MNKSVRAPFAFASLSAPRVNMHEALRYDALTSIKVIDRVIRASYVGTWRNSVDLIAKRLRFLRWLRKKDYIACIFSSPLLFYIGGRYGTLSQQE